jgi:hypothetical protein
MTTADIFPRQANEEMRRKTLIPTSSITVRPRGQCIVRFLPEEMDCDPVFLFGGLDVNGI